MMSLQTMFDFIKCLLSLKYALLMTMVKQINRTIASVLSISDITQL